MFTEENLTIVLIRTTAKHYYSSEGNTIFTGDRITLSNVFRAFSNNSSQNKFKTPDIEMPTFKLHLKPHSVISN